MECKYCLTDVCGDGWKRCPNCGTYNNLSFKFESEYFMGLYDKLR